MARQAADAERKMQTSHYDGEMKGWDWDKYVSLHKQQHAMMESLTDYGYIVMNNGTKVCHFLQGIKSIELEANFVWAQSQNYGTDFDATVSYLGQTVMKKGPSMQPINIARTESQPAKPKVAAFTGKVECKKYSTAVWNLIKKASDAG